MICELSDIVWYIHILWLYDILLYIIELYLQAHLTYVWFLLFLNSRWALPHHDHQHVHWDMEIWPSYIRDFEMKPFLSWGEDVLFPAYLLVGENKGYHVSTINRVFSLGNYGVRHVLNVPLFPSGYLLSMRTSSMALISWDQHPNRVYCRPVGKLSVVHRASFVGSSKYHWPGTCRMLAWFV